MLTSQMDFVALLDKYRAKNACSKGKRFKVLVGAKAGNRYGPGRKRRNGNQLKKYIRFTLAGNGGELALLIRRGVLSLNRNLAIIKDFHDDMAAFYKTDLLRRMAT